MKMVINTDMGVLEELKTDEMLMLLSIYLKTPISKFTFDSLCTKGLIEYSGFTAARVPENLSLTNEGTDKVESFILNSEFRETPNQEDRFSKLAEKLMEIFPPGRKEGTSYMWRDSKHTISKKLKALVKRTGATFSDKEAIEATKRYVDSFNGDYKYMQLLKYFISKRVIIDGSIEESSQLLSFIENPEQSVNGNWTEELI